MGKYSNFAVCRSALTGAAVFDIQVAVTGKDVTIIFTVPISIQLPDEPKA